MKHFTSQFNKIDEAVARALARALTHSKTLEVVEVWEHNMFSEVARPLIEAMNKSSVKKLDIGTHISEEVRARCVYPKDRVKFI